jgi:hypothetical protein
MVGAVSTKRRVTAKDLRSLGLSQIDPESVTIEIDPADLREPNWAALGLKGGIEHRKALSAKYWSDELPDIDQVVIAALLERNEHPTMRRRRDEMRQRL